jgi:hypothetical protein
VFRPNKTLKKTRIKVYNKPALPNLLYGSENWTIKSKDATRITARYTWTDHKRNTEIAKELNITPVLDTVQDYEKNDTTCKSKAT